VRGRAASSQIAVLLFFFTRVRQGRCGNGEKSG
jgi:hypothetical protein